MTWRISRIVLRCGSCRKPIAKGEPFGELELAGARRARCYSCACDFTGFCPFIVEDAATERPVSWQPLLPDSLPGREGTSVEMRERLARLRDQIFGASV